MHVNVQQVFRTGFTHMQGIVYAQWVASHNTLHRCCLCLRLKHCPWVEVQYCATLGTVDHRWEKLPKDIIFLPNALLETWFRCLVMYRHNGRL